MARAMRKPSTGNTQTISNFERCRDIAETKQLEIYLKGLATLKPTSTEVGSSEFEDDSAEAIRLLNAMARKNGRSFEEEFSDPANFRLAAATYPRRDANWHGAAYQ